MYREDVPKTEFRRFEINAQKATVSNPGSETVEQFLARGGAITVVPSGVGSAVPVIVSKQPDGTYKNDWHQQEKSRKRERIPSESFVIFEQAKVKVGKSGRAYIRVTITNGVKMYRCRIQGEHQGDWDEDINVAIRFRNEKLVKLNINIPD